MSRKLALVLIVGIVSATPEALIAGGNIYGTARMERIKGKPYMGYRELVEWSLFLTPAHPTIDGISRRIGTSQWMGTGCVDPCLNCGMNYCKSNLVPGTYSALLTFPYLFATPKVINNISITEGQLTRVDFEMPIDYSTYFFHDHTHPATSWCQTFVATGYGIRGVSFTYAGNNPESVTVTVLGEKEGVLDPALWHPLGSATRYGTSASQTGEDDNWVRWRTGQVPTFPGQRYAVKLTANNGMLQPHRRYKDGNSYVGGQAYLGGQPQSFDLNIVVFSDNDGTTVTMNSNGTKQGHAPTVGRAAYGQTFIARGNGLAAVDCTLSVPWDTVMEWTVRENGPEGPQVGASRRVMGAWDVTSIHGVSFNPDEVPLTAGQTYFIEMRRPYGGLVNPYYMEYAYNDGMAYYLDGTDWGSLPHSDLSMTIVEYMPPPSWLLVEPNAVSHMVDKDSNQPPDTVTITNRANRTVCYTALELQSDWLSVVAPVSACLAPGASGQMTISYTVANLPNGRYEATIAIKDDDPDTLPAELTVTVNIVTAPGDLDGDGDVDMEDFGIFQACLTGSGIPQTDPDCLKARLDGDEDVDEHDLAILQNCFSGPNKRADRNCATGN
jgi:hypothetical protein